MATTKENVHSKVESSTDNSKECKAGSSGLTSTSSSGKPDSGSTRPNRQYNAGARKKRQQQGGSAAWAPVPVWKQQGGVSVAMVPVWDGNNVRIVWTPTWQLEAAAGTGQLIAVSAVQGVGHCRGCSRWGGCEGSRGGTSTDSDRGTGTIRWIVALPKWQRGQQPTRGG